MAGQIAIDIGGTKTLVAVAGTDVAPAVLRLRTDVAAGPVGVVEQIARAVESVPGAVAGGRAFVASPGQLDSRTGVIHYAANLPFRDFPLADALAQRLGVPVSLLGDATAATIAEFSGAAAAGAEHGAYVTVSTGIGVGLVIGGRLAAGGGLPGGELGHVPVLPDDDVRCACGQRGCLEAYASGRGLADRAAEAVAAGVDTRLAGVAPEELSARHVIAAWSAGDRVATALVERAIDLLGLALAGLVRVIAPRRIVLGGGVLLAGGLLEPVRERVAAVLEPNAAGVRASLHPAAHGERSALEGAAALARGDAGAIRLLGPLWPIGAA